MTIYTKLTGNEIAQEPQEVTEADIAYLESLRLNGGPRTKYLLEEFGRDKLGIAVAKNFKTDRILDEALLPLVKKRLAGLEIPDKDPIESVVTEENMDLDSSSIASDMPAKDVPYINKVISDFTAGDEFPGLVNTNPPTHLKHCGNSDVKATGNIFVWTQALSELDTLKPCTQDGTFL